MSWTERLKQFGGFGSDADRAELASLLPLHTAAAASLQRVADLAPTPAVLHDVRPILEKSRAVVERLRALLHDFGAVKPAVRPVVAEPGGHNHWARLLQALEEHREARQRLREVSISVEETDPALSAALASIGAAEDSLNEHLRDLIARADPQALN